MAQQAQGLLIPDWDDGATDMTLNRSSPSPQPSRLTAPSAIRQYMDDARHQAQPNTWMSKAEIPTSEEILDTNMELFTRGAPEECTVSVPVNNIDGPWSSKEDYLEAHYELLREDVLRSLRETVGRVRNKPWGREDEYGTTVGIYENVHIKKLTFSPRGVAVRVSFSLARSGKRVHWEQSKRLITGSLVALTTEEDQFRTQCTMAVVAARPLSDGVDQSPPEIDLFFARPEEFAIDPAQSWIMVEDRASFFEASRYTLRALQKTMREHSPLLLSKHLISLQRQVDSPQYMQMNPRIDMSSAFAAQPSPNTDKGSASLPSESFKNVDILQAWPEDPPTELDKTQQYALRRILTKQLAIIQGPPGTGKTHVSVVALRTILGNMTMGDPPIIVACQTNHALDQLLRHVAEYESEFARLGGRSKDQGIIKKRTLFELKSSQSVPAVAFGLKGPSLKRMRDLEKTMRAILEPMSADKEFLDHKMLLDKRLLTIEQYESLEKGDTDWVQQNPEQTSNEPMVEWLGKNSWVKVDHGTPEDNFFEYEEADLEFEQLKEIEAENAIREEDEIERLKGNHFHLGCRYVGKVASRGAPSITETEIQALLSEKQNLWDINPKLRGAVYNFFLKRFKEEILKSFRLEVRKYQDTAEKRLAGRWEEDHLLLKTQKIIGMTTTGFSKYRALISSLKPKIVLIEEAAETLEALVIATCVPSLEHLILVGDHQQLRPRCQVKDYEDAPYNLNVSLFERLIKNNVEFDTLRRQRRMIPEIRRLLRPIYGDLISDHSSVKERKLPSVTGVGCDSFFFTHSWPESKDNQMSSCNAMEAEMIAEFFNHLYLNGHPVDSITVLTFYNGQRKLILRKLLDHPTLGSSRSRFNVVTVDSYQGEENEIILLSLVRSNQFGHIGFLGVDNRVCVALSRAKRGFYLFGNGEQLACESKTWAEVITLLAGKGGHLPKEGPTMRIGFHLPLKCHTHGRMTYIEAPDDFALVSGGCEIKCHERLPCGHPCPVRCHPYPHSSITCALSCPKVLRCGHKCAGICSDESCHCTLCPKTTGSLIRPGANLNQTNLNPSPERQRPGSSSSGSDSVKWNNFANGGSKQHDREAVRQANDNYEKQQRLVEERSRTAYATVGSTGTPSPVRQYGFSKNTMVGPVDGAGGRRKYRDTFRPGPPDLIPSLLD
ncbi:uncharacterized protein K452DRAFT_320697 [Aplosporella prunicola CBS 121167]|uniref:Helicase ATP-binding domain-containing protein n=1 Tax=Aplosporella prunicola CBS 121167 TaxID=1176127 RepID=A0A6A6B4J4_9PEZI|nr:uncharacterized protein K452DRAFT_320697 [Aplosporella prunicola CBS 121167]KAF2139072.1 hypothetical protein K452DRAFT_320697 [Aplosporella prunicola CBS 121167]